MSIASAALPIPIEPIEDMPVLGSILCTCELVYIEVKNAKIHFPHNITQQENWKYEYLH